MPQDAATTPYDEEEFLQLVAACLQMADTGLRESFMEIEAALYALDPERAESQLLHGIRLSANGENEEALKIFAQLIENEPHMTLAHYYSGKTYQLQKDFESAVRAYEQCVIIDPTFTDAYVALSAVCGELGDAKAGFEMAVTALNIEPTSMQLWSQMSAFLPQISMKQAYAPLITAIMRAFDAGISAQGFFSQPVLRCLDTYAPMQELLAWCEEGAERSVLFDAEQAQWMSDPFLLSAMRHILFMRPDYEALMIATRRAFLIEISEGNLGAFDEAALGFLSALSSHCFINEYAFFESEDEARRVNELIENISGGAIESDMARALSIAMVGCYRLFSDVAISDVLEKEIARLNMPALTSMALQLIDQPRKEQEYKQRVQAITQIDDDVSKLVQAMYEAHPYPRWVNLPMTQILTFPSYIKATMPYLRQEQLPKIPTNEHDALSILVAGCGTGQHPAMVAKRFPNAQVLAVDLSRSSLGYAQMKADELGIQNIEFRHGDIMKLPELKQQFDIVESVGVLHHMHDPVAGWEAITACLKPGGWMNIGLYDYHKRDFVRWAWQLIKEKPYGDSNEDIRRFRKHILAYHQENPEDEVCNSMIRTRDFYQLSECRDLLFHVQETQYTVDELRKIINKLGLKFMGMPTSFLGQSDQLTKGDAAITNWQSMKQWGAARLAKPDMFNHMHVIWLKKPT